MLDIKLQLKDNNILYKFWAFDWMNLNENKGSFCLSCHLLPAIDPTQQNWKCLHIRSHQYTEFRVSNFWSRLSLGRNLDFFISLGFDVQTNSNHKTQKVKLYSVRAVKRYLNDKNLVHAWQVTATISKFSPRIFERYFRNSFPRYAFGANTQADSAIKVSEGRTPRFLSGAV